MRCSSCEPLLDAYIEHELPPKKALELTNHLGGCKACSAVLRELRVVDALLTTARTSDLPPNFSFAAMVEVRNMPPPRKRPAMVWIALAMYLVCAWIAGSVALVVARGGHPTSTGLSSLTGGIAGGGAWHAIAGTLHGFSTFTPLVIPTVAVILAVDLALLATVFFFYRAVRPWVAARLADGETS